MYALCLSDMLATVNLGQTAQKTNPAPYTGSDDDPEPEAVNKKAISIVNRVRDKLTGQFIESAGKLADVDG